MRRGTLYLAVVLALAVSSAAPARAAGSGGNDTLSSWSGLWSWLVAVVSHQPALQTDCDRGSHMDPNGGCTATVAPLSECGSQIDPDGRCRAAVAPLSDCGSHMDPDGHCNAV
jgi:hypothetical protein